MSKRPPLQRDNIAQHRMQYLYSSLQTRLLSFCFINLFIASLETLFRTLLLASCFPLCGERISCLFFQFNIGKNVYQKCDVVSNITVHKEIP